MRTLLWPALVATLALTLLTGVLYPVAITGLAAVAFPRQARGSLAMREGKPVGSDLIGQFTDDPKYFWSRPSATGPVPDNGAASSGSNLGPSNPALTDAIGERIAALKASDPANIMPIPIDLVTTSGSGLDPHISPASAAYQVQRVARIRGMDPAQVTALVAAHTEGRQLGILGESRLNVLLLNLALDSVTAEH